MLDVFVLLTGPLLSSLIIRFIIPSSELLIILMTPELSLFVGVVGTPMSETDAPPMPDVRAVTLVKETARFYLQICI